jgi:copper chaperone CopZ
MFQTLLAISGMRDNDCRERLLDAIRRVDGVTDVRLSLIRGRAEITHDSTCDPAALIQAVVRAGYAAQHVEPSPGVQTVGRRRLGRS